MNTKKRRRVAKALDAAPLSPARDFDLNIEKVLDGWEVSHAIREIIANALDESVLTSTEIPEIVQRASNRWVIRDFGGDFAINILRRKKTQRREGGPET